METSINQWDIECYGLWESKTRAINFGIEAIEKVHKALGTTKIVKRVNLDKKEKAKDQALEHLNRRNWGAEGESAKEIEE